MLDAGSDMEAVHRSRIVTLKAQHRSLSELGVEVAVLAEALPHSRPERLAAEVHHRREGPRDQGGAGFVGADAPHGVGKISLEAGGKVQLLREKGASVDVGGAVDLVQTVEARDADLLEGLALDFTYHLDILLLGRRAVAYHIEY